MPKKKLGNQINIIIRLKVSVLNLLFHNVNFSKGLTHLKSSFAKRTLYTTYFLSC